GYGCLSRLRSFHSRHASRLLYSSRIRRRLFDIALPGLRGWQGRPATAEAPDAFISAKLPGLPQGRAPPAPEQAEVRGLGDSIVDNKPSKPHPECWRRQSALLLS